MNKWTTYGLLIIVSGLIMMYGGFITLFPIFTQSQEELEIFEEIVFSSKGETFKLIWPVFIMIVGLFAYVFWLGRSFFCFS